jgi:hypothetical protein
MRNLTCENGLIHPSIPVGAIAMLNTGILEGPISGLSILWPQSVSRPFIPRNSLDAVPSEDRPVEIMLILFCTTAPENESCGIYF